MQLRNRFDRRVEGSAGPHADAAEQEGGGKNADSSLEAADAAAPQNDLANVAEHVRTVLAAAEAAAEKLRTDAEQDVVRVRQQAAKAAHDLREQAVADADADRSEARRQLTRAKEEARTIRQDADSYADTRKRDAEAQAARVVREAEHRAAEIADAAAKRHEALVNDIAFSEGRMRELAENLRDVAQQLTEVADSSGREEGTGGDEGLDDALSRLAVEENGAEAAVEWTPR